MNTPIRTVEGTTTPDDTKDRMVECGNPHCRKKHRHSERVWDQSSHLVQSLACPTCLEPSYIETTTLA